MAVLQHFQYLRGVLQVGDECSGRCSRRDLERFKRAGACIWFKELMHACGSRTECMPGVQEADLMYANSRGGFARDRTVCCCAKSPTICASSQSVIQLKAGRPLC